ncbi:DUF116 domain-containing protein [Methanobacterium alcaliphilum]|uniref:DUF116 domain-containing protein n=1 Tax=Methanobacterium alcaliphilum TaxID=392018 RepID=UPI00200AAC23|nr:DUF116 domain-containing protein [Methanobacterium alcaliphilum]MCK9151720.1 DUF116 domain-containing protein [Methanobacterium alcaliphilum]
MFSEFYQIFGQMVFLAGVIVLALLLISLVLGKVLIKQDKLIFPKVMLFTIDLFYGPFKKFSESMGFDEQLVDHMGVEVRNKVNKKSYESIDGEDRLLVLPHCLRHPECEAKLESSGLICTHCNKCVIGFLKEKAENKGYKVFIIPGSTFLKKIIEQNNFKAVLGVACYQDLNIAMMKLSKFSPQGVPLSRDGCFKTKVDTKAVLEKMGYVEKLNDTSSIANISPCSQEKHEKRSI